jgi:tetratricopeptide (TPR) repeat protein
MLENDGNYDLALAKYSAAIDRYPAFVAAIINRADIELRKQWWWKARSDYAQALKINPNSLAASVGLANVLWKKDRKDEGEAIGNIVEAVAKNADQKDSTGRKDMDGLKRAHYALGMIYLDLYFPEAVEEFKKYLRMDPGDGYVWNNLGVAFEHADMLPEAVSAWIAAVHLVGKRDSAILYNIERVIKEDDVFGTAWCNRIGVKDDIKALDAPSLWSQANATCKWD